jgi:hypothetical protein
MSSQKLPPNQRSMRMHEILPSCGKCGYPLQGLPSDVSRCPECGVSISYARHLAASRPKSRFDLFLRFYMMAACAQALVFLISLNIGSAHTSNTVDPAKLLRHDIGFWNGLFALCFGVVGVAHAIFSRIARRSKLFWLIVLVFLFLSVMSIAP